jgi:osmotically-inducible protein OsmY
MPHWTKKTDAEIREQVDAEVAWDTRLLLESLEVLVADGVVTLRGCVESWAKKVAARDAAFRVDGVVEVENQISVEIPEALRTTDVELARAVRHALEFDVLIPDADIHTAVLDGFVTLDGEVAFWSQAEDAERAIRNLRGVVGIVNRLTVQHASAEGEIHHSIEAALTRRAARALQHVKVDLDGAEARVSGHVDSWAERAAVLGAVRGTRGVAMVKDKLMVC